MGARLLFTTVAVVMAAFVPKPASASPTERVTLRLAKVELANRKASGSPWDGLDGPDPKGYLRLGIRDGLKCKVVGEIAVPHRRNTWTVDLDSEATFTIPTGSELCYEARLVDVDAVEDDLIGAGGDVVKDDATVLAVGQARFSIVISRAKAASAPPSELRGLGQSLEHDRACRSTPWKPAGTGWSRSGQCKVWMGGDIKPNPKEWSDRLSALGVKDITFKQVNGSFERPQWIVAGRHPSGLLVRVEFWMVGGAGPAGKAAYDDEGYHWQTPFLSFGVAR